MDGKINFEEIGGRFLNKYTIFLGLECMVHGCSTAVVCVKVQVISISVMLLLAFSIFTLVYEKYADGKQMDLHLRQIAFTHRNSRSGHR